MAEMVDQGVVAKNYSYPDSSVATGAKIYARFRIESASGGGKVAEKERSKSGLGYSASEVPSQTGAMQ